MSNRVDLSIVIPALREEKRIGTTLDKLAVFMKSTSLKYEVIIVAAAGGDNTVKVADLRRSKFQRFHILKLNNVVGKGRDVRDGMLAAKGRAVLFMDADLATPLKYINIFYDHFQNGDDIVIATRNLKKHHKSIFRRSVSYCGNLIFRLVSGVWVEDSQCGFKLFSARATRVCFERLTIMKWGFDMELLAIAKFKGFTLRQVRVNDWKHMSGGSFDVNPLNNSLSSLADLSKILLNRIRQRYR